MEAPDIPSLVYKAASQIPVGRVAAYGDIASALGDIKASRAVGTILSQNPEPIKVPCHRVVYSNGASGWYFGKGKNADVKASLLMSEGVKVTNGKVENFSALRFRDFDIPPVLKELQEEQDQIRESVIIRECSFDCIVGLDVSYAGGRAFGAAAVYDSEGKYCKTNIAESCVGFPYIPSYLSYRELPVFSKLVNVKNAVYLIDGHGLLHPRAGIASHLGVVCGVPAIGAAKSLLCGHVEHPEAERSCITVNNEVLGVMLQGKHKSYVSVGNLTTLEQAEEICRLCLHNGIPLPLLTAHKEAERAKKERLGTSDCTAFSSA